MKTYHLSEKALARLALPGEYLFSLIPKNVPNRENGAIFNFPGKTGQRFVCYCSSGKTQLIFHLPHASCRPALSWLLRIHRCNDGLYIVVGNNVFEKVIIRNKAIVHVSIQEFPLPKNYDDATVILFCTRDIALESKELRSLIGPPKPVLWKKDISSPRLHLLKKTLIPVTLVAGCLIFFLPKGSFGLADNSTNSTILIEQTPRNYLDVSHIISHIKTINSQMLEDSWISKLEISNEFVNIHLHGKDIVGFLDSAGAAYTISANTIDLTQTFQASDDDKQAVYLQLLGKIPPGRPKIPKYPR